MFKYIAGNNIKHTIKCSHRILMSNKLPIINFAIEETKNKKKIYNEHQNLIKNLNNRYKIAIKLSSFEFDKILLNNIIQNANQKNIQVIIDAEKGIDYDRYNDISNEIIVNHNKEKCNVIKTYQMYRKDSFETLKEDSKFFSSKDIFFGTKIVRGAYWNTENKNDYLYTNKEDTDTNYNKGILYLSENDYKTYNILATHNKESINLGKLMNQYKKKQVFDFAHLLGMREKIYNKIVMEGENVHVYVPYGPYKEMIPYLFRRLYENIDTIKYIL